MTPTRRVTFYLNGVHCGTNLTDEQTAQVRDAAIAAWNGDGPAHLSCIGNDGSPPMLLNLHQVLLIKTEEITPAMRLGVDYDSMHQG